MLVQDTLTRQYDIVSQPAGGPALLIFKKLLKSCKIHTKSPF